MKLLKLGLVLLSFSLITFASAQTEKKERINNKEPNQEKRFKEIDANNDGFIDLAEFKAEHEKRKSMRPKDEGRKKKRIENSDKPVKRINSPERMKKRKELKPERDPEKIFKMKDVNSDNLLDLKEFKSRPQRNPQP